LDYAYSVVLNDMVINDIEVYEYMKNNIIGRLGEPRLRLIKALLAEKYGKRNHTADEMLCVINENNLQLYRANGGQIPERQIANAMSIAHKKLKKQPKEKEKIEHHPSCGCASCDTGGEHIIINPHS